MTLHKFTPQNNGAGIRTQRADVTVCCRCCAGEEGAHKDLFELFESEKYGRFNLMMTDATHELVDVGDRDTYYSWAGESFTFPRHVLLVGW